MPLNVSELGLNIIQLISNLYVDVPIDRWPRVHPVYAEKRL